MRYTPTQWKAGDVVTSEKLNKIEQGIASNGGGSGGGILIVTGILSGATVTLDKTWKEIYDADFAVIKIISQEPMIISYAVISNIYFTGSKYELSVTTDETIIYFDTDTENGYPSTTLHDQGQKE